MQDSLAFVRLSEKDSRGAIKCRTERRRFAEPVVFVSSSRGGRWFGEVTSGGGERKHPQRIQLILGVPVACRPAFQCELTRPNLDAALMRRIQDSKTPVCAYGYDTT